MRALPTCLLILTMLVGTTAAADPPTDTESAPTNPPKPLLRWNVEAALGPPPGSVLLEPVEVTGHRDAFREADQRMKKTIDALPCSGCGGETAKEKVGVVEKVLTGAAAILKDQFVATEEDAVPMGIKDRAEAEAQQRVFLRPGQQP